MSIQIVLRTDRGTRDELIQLLTNHHFEITDPKFPPPEEHHVYFYWFEKSEYKSYDGIEASIWPATFCESGPEREGWILHTRTRSAASYFDREMQNEIIRLAQEQFGGEFYNDWYGDNQFTPLVPDTHAPIERGIAMIASWTREQLSKVSMSVPDPIVGNGNQDETMQELFRFIDPTTVLYNALVPFAVAALEYFFSQVFKLMLAHDPNCKEKMAKEARKVEMSDAVALANGMKTIEDIVASWYTFQNFDAVNRAYRDWFGIDFWRIIRTEMNRGSKVQMLSDVLNDIVERRHGVIHRFEFGLDLDKQAVRDIFDAIEHTIGVFIAALEAERGLRVKDMLPY